jgi:Ca2+-binding EF-hand superfamily protein
MVSSVNSPTVSMTRPTAVEMKQRRQEMFTQMDANGDGSVDKAEFTAFGKQMAQQINGPDRTEEIFAAIDTNGDGVISQAESEAGCRPA